MSSRRIHIGVCGIGFGHASRVSILIKTFNELGWTTSISSYSDGFRYLEKLGVSVKPSPGISYGILPEGKVSIKMTIYRNIFLPIKLLAQISCELNYIEGADLVLSDSRASTIIAGKIARKPVLTILNQFNIRVEYPRYPRIIELVEAMTQVVGQIWSLSDKILIADYPEPYTISKQNLVIPEKVLSKVEFIGPLIDKQPSDLPSRAALCEKYGLNPDSRPVILYHATGPRYERRELTKLILPLLEKLSNEYQVLATLGGDSFQVSLNENLKVLSWIEEPLEAIKLADVVVCRAGQTTLAKALAYGKPLIMIPIPGHGEQIGNASSIADMGAGILLPQEELSVESLRQALRQILSNDAFRSSAEKYAALLRDLKPVKRIISAVESLLV